MIKKSSDSSRERLKVIPQKDEDFLSPRNILRSFEVDEESMIRRNMEVIKNLRFFEGKIESDTQKDETFLP